MHTNEGFLNVRFHVRAPTFFQQCRDQQWYIHQLQALQAGYSAQIADIKEQLANQISKSGPSVHGKPSGPLGNVSLGYPVVGHPSGIVFRPGTASPRNGAKGSQKFSSLAQQPFNRLPPGRNKAVSDSRLAPSCQHSDNTELDCGHLSSCSDSEDSSSEETLDIVLNAGNASGGATAVGEREMNDVDDETMFGDNDVSFLHTVPSVSLPEIDSLTYNEPSMESLTSLSAARTPTQNSLSSAQTLATSTHMSLEDEMLLFRLMNLREASHKSGNSVALASGSSRIEGLAPQRMVRPSTSGGHPIDEGVSRSIIGGTGEAEVAPLPSLASCPSVSGDKPSGVKPMPSLPKGYFFFF